MEITLVRSKQYLKTFLKYTFIKNNIIFSSVAQMYYQRYLIAIDNKHS